MNDIYGFRGENRWLSNFAEVEPFTIHGIEYNTVENFYCAAKTQDCDQKRYIATLPPGKAKRYCNPKAGNVTLNPMWNNTYRMIVMQTGLKEKFSQPKFKELLLATGRCYIEETNHWGDTFWGVCDGIGENNLGKMIMALRLRLQLEEIRNG